MSAPNLARDGGGPRWFLDGRPLRCGDGVEVRVELGEWLRVRWELDPSGAPVLYRWVPDAENGDYGVSLTIRSASPFDLRWPS